MRTASISELKANLSRYLREVRRGGEVEVLDRGKPVARLVPASASQHGDRERLIAAGLLRPGSGETAAILEEPPPNVPAKLSEALEQDRADRL